ncbi:uncharacterized protein LOC131202621 [Ahaetulla prasina]|uniref:uncharacterized protein LOC131202621 n=1 Tax=Ahaetulla prasina TaxID=499056 RepID=UPI002647904E|nr:uncharacterized protein LOC131202621 [Ahaetulla prasina]
MGRFIFVSLGLLVVAFSLNGAKGCCCPSDWLPENGFCYKVFNEHKNWNDAETFCRTYKPGCHLASIHGSEESTELAEYVSDYLKSGGNVWIGLNDPQKQRSWQWTDRSQSNYLPWKQGEPNNSGNNEYCVELWRDSGYKDWNDENCASTRAYLCKCRFYANTSENHSFSSVREVPGKVWRSKEAPHPPPAEISALAPLRFMDAFCSLDLTLLLLMGQKPPSPPVLILAVSGGSELTGKEGRKTMGQVAFLSLGLLAMFLSLRGVEGYSCPVDWLPRNNFCYKIFSKPKTWFDAETYCRKLKPGCHLASLHNNKDSVALADYISDYLAGQGHVWIGLRDTKQNYIWEWTDRSTTDYLPWRNNQPDHFQNKEFCVEIVDFTEYLQWNDDECEALRPFLCQCKY